MRLWYPATVQAMRVIYMHHNVTRGIPVDDGLAVMLDAGLRVVVLLKLPSSVRVHGAPAVPALRPRSDALYSAKP